MPLSRRQRSEGASAPPSAPASDQVVAWARGARGADGFSVCEAQRAAEPHGRRRAPSGHDLLAARGRLRRVDGAGRVLAAPRDAAVDAVAAEGALRPAARRGAPPRAERGVGRVHPR
eukprot:CAMPEP_0195599032 /NCGR_PEP_ID=MMETSP0815-20121206/3821_1 /TAXON_ID=97485 /ORGANISM="Prymnesium parvum, Strain Texoma1" /LENGTH=116 /DNA_ID=CAMNT_0040738451 /DNA_START=288 /DNA_END=634 /DNA_ORIENTATION=-